MKKLLAKLASSRKFAALILGLVTAVGARLGFDEAVAEQITQAVVLLVSAYLVSQGMADHGKERAKVGASPPLTLSPDGSMRNAITGAILDTGHISTRGKWVAGDGQGPLKFLSPDDQTPGPEAP